jgi:hypothetical protein
MDTSVFSDINWLGVLAGAAAYFLLGAIWYSFLFQKQWLSYHSIDPNNPGAKKGMAAIMTTSFLQMFIVSIGLAILIERLELTQAISGVKLGFTTGLLFSFTAISITYLYLQKPLGLHFIDGLYHTVGQILSATIICLLK